MSNNRPLRVFLCHSSNDKPVVRELYQKLRAEAWIQPWLDEEELYPGQDWNLEIEKAVEAADAIVVCLSKNSITKEGYVQREIRIALDYADYKPEGTLFIIPIRLDECTPPKRLIRWQYADYFEGQRKRDSQRLLVSLQRRADSLGLKLEEPATKAEKNVEKIKPDSTVDVKHSKLISPETSSALKESKPEFISHPTPDWIAVNKITLSNGMEFMCVPAGRFLMGSNKSSDGLGDVTPQRVIDIPYDYWISRYPVTNVQYNQFKKKAFPRGEEQHPVVSISWSDAMVYCLWLYSFFKTVLPLNLILRLPTETEWEKSARGIDGRRYPWGNDFDTNKCNVPSSYWAGFSLSRSSTPLGKYSPQGDSPYGCGDIAGNVWEWCHSLYKPYPYNIDDGGEEEIAVGKRVIRGGTHVHHSGLARCTYRSSKDASSKNVLIGFRVCLAPAFST